MQRRTLPENHLNIVDDFTKSVFFAFSLPAYFFFNLGLTSCAFIVLLKLTKCTSFAYQKKTLNRSAFDRIKIGEQLPYLSSLLTGGQRGIRRCMVEKLGRDNRKKAWNRVILSKLELRSIWRCCSGHQASIPSGSYYDRSSLYQIIWSHQANRHSNPGLLKGNVQPSHFTTARRKADMSFV